MRLSAKSPVLFLAAAVVAGAAAVGGWQTVGFVRGDEPVPKQAVAIAHGDDRLPSTTASDWVTYADYVVVVTPTSERESQPSDEDLKRGLGVIDRVLQMSVSRVVWSRQGADVPAPTTFGWNAYGWTWRGDTANRVQLVDPDQPRIESGHSYVMAIQWVPTHCADGVRIEGAWRGLGSGSNLPYDNTTIGVGEVGSQEVSGTDATRRAAKVGDPGFGLKDAVAGRPISDLSKRLAAAKPYGKTVDYGQSVTPC